MKPNAKGFTLIELLTVVTVIGILIAIAAPSFATFISNYRATTAINDLLQGITITRNEALKRGRRVTLSAINGSWTNGWTVFVDVPGTSPPPVPVWSSGETLLYRHGVLPATITVAGSADNATPFNGANYVAFDGSGYLSSNTPAINGGIAIKDRTGNTTNWRTLCLSLYGRPRIISNLTTAGNCSGG